jgi:chemotaxis signal transduction protein
MKDITQQQKMEAVWLERAKRLSKRPVLADKRQDVLPVMVLGIGKERYGVDLADVAEVLATVRATPVPGAAAVFSGVINVHGEIRPVLDLRCLLGIETVPDPGLARVILLRYSGREMGLEIDTVEQIRWIESGELRAGGDPEATSSEHIKGSTKDLLMLLSTEALFAALDTGVTT